MFSRCLAVALAAAAALALPVNFAQAQVGAYPNRPIKIIVPYTAGGGNDYLGRLLAERMQPALGQPVVVENKPGASTVIGAEFVARQPPNGYTILVITNTIVNNVSFFPKLPYDPVRDFEPISLVATTPFVLAVNSNTPVKSIREFIALARARPGTFTYGTAGNGSPQHLAAELLKSVAGIDMLHVPYKGSEGILAALLAGDITTTIGAINSLLPHARTGKLRLVAVVGGSRTTLLPDVPAIAETLPGYEFEVWYGLFAPAGTPRPIIDRLNAEINRVVRDPQVIKEKLNPLGFAAVGTTPERFMEIIKADIVKSATIIKNANIRPE